MFSADLLMEYDAPRAPNSSALATLPSVLDTCRIFFVGAFSRKGSVTCETSAGPIAFVRRTVSMASGSKAKAVSCTLCGGAISTKDKVWRREGEDARCQRY